MSLGDAVMGYAVGKAVINGNSRPLYYVCLSCLVFLIVGSIIVGIAMATGVEKDKLTTNGKKNQTPRSS